MINLKILKLKLFQETACYKKPFAFKVAETYPLPPYSTVIGMFHKILGAGPNEYHSMDISVQGEYESIFSNYQTLRMFKGKDQVTAMPRNVHQLLNVNLVIHIQSDDETIDRIYQNIVTGKETFSLGRNEDLVRVDEVKIVKELKKKYDQFVNNYNAYVPLQLMNKGETGINYRLNTVYTIENDLRKWHKVDVKYIEKHTNKLLKEGWEDEDGDNIYWCECR